MEPLKKTTMRAILLKEINGPLVVEEVPIPKPQPGQVLVKMEASAIHPADFTMIRGQYGVTKSLPFIPGLEGCGTVIENGGGLLGWKLTGHKVAASSTAKTTGTWAEYMIAESSKCIPLDNDITFEEGAFAIGNPLTALGFYDMAQNEKARAVIFSAACSAVARMSSRYFEFKGMEVINIVRRSEQVEILKAEGVKHILNSSDINFEENLNELITKLNPTVFFDSVAGSLTGTVLKAMPSRSVCFLYGFLSKDKCEIDGRDMRMKDKTLRGFWLTQWLKEKGMVSLLSSLSEMKSNLKTSLKTVVSKVISIDEIEEGILYYKKHMSEGKIVINFSKKKGNLFSEVSEKNEIEKKEEPILEIKKQIEEEEKKVEPEVENEINKERDNKKQIEDESEEK